jgi:hypothetical protein
MYHQPERVHPKKVNFVFLKSLYGDEPAHIMRGWYPSSPSAFHHSNTLSEEIDESTTVAQILWVLLKRKKGKEGPAFNFKLHLHFYLDIPQKPSKSKFDIWENGRGFHRDPLTHMGSKLRDYDTLYALPDKSCRLYLYSDGPAPRVFGNLWQPHKKYILKGEWVFRSRMSYAPTCMCLRHLWHFGFHRQRLYPCRRDGARLLVPTLSKPNCQCIALARGLGQPRLSNHT